MSRMWSWFGHARMIGPTTVQSAAVDRRKDTYKTVFVVKSREVFAIRVIRVQVVRGPI